MLRDAWFIMLLVGAGLIIAALAVTFVPAIWIKRREIAALRDQSRGKLALTYDDGPGPSLHGRLLELLHVRQARATFFLVGFRAERYPGVCDALAVGGHEVGCHTHWHRHAWKTPPWLAAADVGYGYRTMSKWMPPNAPFRPPFGKLTLWNWLAAKRHKAPLSFWTCDGCDTHPTLPDPRRVVDNIVSSRGGVVLIHSHDRGQDREEYVLRLTEALLNAAQEHGLKVCTMSELRNGSMNQERSRGRDA